MTARDSLTAWLKFRTAIWHDSQTGHDQTGNDLLCQEAADRIAELEAKLAEAEDIINASPAVQKAIRRAREEEREACERIGRDDPFLTGFGVAERIKARSIPSPPAEEKTP